mmetsp:Transcript_32191/g.80608  ORF Transcript_32191/g.80608 Transcript_32191/m.80608 type:complete len:418 (+) Transcript_32191:742-1995(+)
MDALKHSLQRQPDGGKGLRDGQRLALRDGARPDAGVGHQVIRVHQLEVVAALDHHAPQRLAILRHLGGHLPHHLRHAARLADQLERLPVARRVHLALDLRGHGALLERALQAPHLGRLAVHQHDVRRPQLVHEAARLWVVGVGAEGDGLHRHAQRLLQARLAHDLGRLCQDLAGHGALDGEIRDDDAVPLVLAPRLQQLAADARLQHGGGGHDHAGAHVIEVRRGEMLDPAEEEGVAMLRLKCLLDIVVHHLNVGLVHAQRAAREARGLVDGHVVDLGVRFPVVVQDEQQLLRAAERHHRQQHAPAALHHGAHHLHEPLLALLAGAVARHAVRGLHNDDVGRLVGGVGARQVAVRLARVVAGVEAAHALDVYHEHASAQHVARGVGRDNDAVAQVQGLPEVDDLHLLHRRLQVVPRE